MRRLFLLGSLFLLASAAMAQMQPHTTNPADDVARRAIDVMAGSDWEKARYFAFTFIVEREGKVMVSFPQRWDRVTGEYRVSGKDQQGNDFVVVMNVKTKQGRGWQNGKEVADPKDLLTLGYNRFVNDTYWLLTPFKSMDAGVQRELASPKSDCGTIWDVVKVTGDPSAGIPTESSWMWVNRDTGLVDKWEMKLQGSRADEPPMPVFFHQYRRINGILLSTWREVRGKDQWIHLDDIRIMSETPKTAFAPPV
jgi:hypothetical protein